MASIQNISDTALLTALFRAQESERQDALFHDPYARQLAGERGQEIQQAIPGGPHSGYPIVIRTYVLDNFITRLLQQESIDTVVNLGAGLDTRPYRLDLPSSLQWIEVDSQELLDYKQQKLAAATPHCTLKRIGLDLTNTQERHRLLTRVDTQAHSVLVLTEGVLNYLTEQQVRSLGQDLAACQHINWWCTDLASPILLHILQLIWGHALKTGNVQFQFTPSNEQTFFRGLGWDIVERADPHIAHTLHREVSLEKFFHLLSHLPEKHVQETFSFGSHLILKNLHEFSTNRKSMLSEVE